MTPGGSSSPRRIFSFFSSKRFRITSHWRSVRSSRSARSFAEDRAQELLFRRPLRLAFRRDLADQDVARLDRRADADDAALVEIPQERLRDVGDVARDLLGAQLRVARLDLELLDVNRR